jgi:hypothetical protein
VWLGKDVVRRQPTSFFNDGIHRLISQWDKCINSFGNYFGGFHLTAPHIIIALEKERHTMQVDTAEVGKALT